MAHVEPSGSLGPLDELSDDDRTTLLNVLDALVANTRVKTAVNS